tara:strand:+ start:1159 stop:1407 length:249 start_codon:yes stop_codon:yes gene_type:complete
MKNLSNAEILDFVVLDGNRNDVYAVMSMPIIYTKTGHVEAIIQHYSISEGFSGENLILQTGDEFEFISDEELSEIIHKMKAA